MKSRILSNPLVFSAIVAMALTLPLGVSAWDTNSAGATSNVPTGSKFITSAAQVNLGEIDLGKLAEQKANDPAIRDFGKRMVEDHTMLESELQNIAKAQGVALPTHPGAVTNSLNAQLSSDSGAKFDDAYINHMLSGHKQAIADFEYEIEQGQTPAIKSYAEKALPVIQDHIRIAEDVAGKMQLSGKAGLEAPAKAISAHT